MCKLHLIFDKQFSFFLWLELKYRLCMRCEQFIKLYLFTCEILDYSDRMIEKFKGVLIFEK